MTFTSRPTGVPHLTRPSGVRTAGGFGGQPQPPMPLCPLAAESRAFPAVAVGAQQLEVPLCVRASQRERNEVVELKVAVRAARDAAAVVALPHEQLYIARDSVASRRSRLRRSSLAAFLANLLVEEGCNEGICSAVLLAGDMLDLDLLECRSKRACTVAPGPRPSAEA